MQKVIEFKCKNCDVCFSLRESYVEYNIKTGRSVGVFCSNKCCNKYRFKENSIIKPCSQCGTIIKRQMNAVKKSKSGFVFCNRSCSAKYNNTHKTTGTRRSKFEVWVEQQLAIDFPQLNPVYNSKEIINSELDIYFPELKLAIELNGIFHYEPIYGADKLASIQNNDDRKLQACYERGIEVVIIDISSLKYFKPSAANKYYSIIKDILIKKLSRPAGT